MKVEKCGKSVDIAYWAGKPRPVLYVHGSGFDGSLWFGQLKEVGGYAIDLPNRGFSGEAEIESVEDYAFYVAKVAEKLAPRIVFVGHSLGGAVVQRLYLEFRRIVKGLVLVGTGARLRVLPQILKGLKSKPAETIDFFINYSFGDREKAAGWVEKCRKMLLERKSLLLKDLTICDKFDLLEDFRSGKVKIEAPTLIIVGEKDRLTPVKYSKFFYSVIPGSKLAVIRGAGHMVMVEKPKEFNETLSKFLSSLQV